MSNNLSRKVKRKKANKNIKKMKKDMVKQVGLFKLLPTECNVCDKPFDKTSKEDHMTWRVAVNEEHRKVALVCPDCQENKDETNDSA
jgi:hypothetical protein